MDFKHCCKKYSEKLDHSCILKIWNGHLIMLRTTNTLREKHLLCFLPCHGCPHRFAPIDLFVPFLFARDKSFCSCCRMVCFCRACHWTFLCFKESVSSFNCEICWLLSFQTKRFQFSCHWFVFRQKKASYKPHTHQEDAFSFSLNLAITLFFLTCVFLVNIHCSLEMHFWTKGQGCQRGDPTMLHEAPGEEVTQAGEPGMSSLFCYNVHASGGWLESGDIG